MKQSTFYNKYKNITEVSVDKTFPIAKKRLEQHNAATDAHDAAFNEHLGQHNVAVDAHGPAFDARLQDYYTRSEVSGAIAAAVQSAYKYIGKVADMATLTNTGIKTYGNVYHVVTTDAGTSAEYYWNGSAWEEFGTNILGTIKNPIPLTTCGQDPCSGGATGCIDLNDYTVPGVYGMQYSDDATHVSNRPVTVGRAFVLTVTGNNSTPSVLWQEYISWGPETYGDGTLGESIDKNLMRKYVRYATKSGNTFTWSSWDQLDLTADRKAADAKLQSSLDGLQGSLNAHIGTDAATAKHISDEERTKWNNKQNTTLSTADRVVITDSAKKISTSSTITVAELNTLDGIDTTTTIKSQLDSIAEHLGVIDGQTGYYDFSNYTVILSQTLKLTFESKEESYENAYFAVSKKLTDSDVQTSFPSDLVTTCKLTSGAGARSITFKCRGKFFYSATTYPFGYKPRSSESWKVIAAGGVIDGTNLWGTAAVDVFAGDTVVFMYSNTSASATSQPTTAAFVPWNGENLVPPDQTSGDVTEDMLVNYATKTYVTSALDNYYTKGESNGKYSSVGHKHDALYDIKGSADAVLNVVNTHAANTDGSLTNIHVTDVDRTSWNMAYTHTTNSGIHVTANNESDWNDAYDHSISTAGTIHGLGIVEYVNGLGIGATGARVYLSTPFAADTLSTDAKIDEASELNVSDGIKELGSYDWVDGTSIRARLSLRRGIIPGNADGKYMSVGTIVSNKACDASAMFEVRCYDDGFKSLFFDGKKIALIQNDLRSEEGEWIPDASGAQITIDGYNGPDNISGSDEIEFYDKTGTISSAMNDSLTVSSAITKLAYQSRSLGIQLNGTTSMVNDLDVALVGLGSTVETLSSTVSKLSSPVGTFTWWLGGYYNIPKGWVICNGSTLKNTDGKFNSLANVLGFSSKQNIVLPDLMGRFIKAGVISGQLQAAGLPNITGEYVHSSAYKADSETGAFLRESIKSSLSSDGSGGDSDNHMTFDASRCSPIYGGSDTVTPKNISAFPLIYTGTSEQFYGTTTSANLFVYPTDTADTVDQYLHRSRNNHVFDRVTGTKYILPNLPDVYDAAMIGYRPSISIDDVTYTNEEDYNVWVGGELYYAWIDKSQVMPTTNTYYVKCYTKSSYVDANTQTYMNYGGIMVENGTYPSVIMNHAPSADFYFLGTADMLSTEDDRVYVDVNNLHSSQVSLFLVARHHNSADELRYLLPKHIKDALTPVTFKYRYSATSSTDTQSKYMNACSIFLPTEKMLKLIPCDTFYTQYFLTCEYGWNGLASSGSVLVQFGTGTGEHYSSVATVVTDAQDATRYYVIAIS